MSARKMRPATSQWLADNLHLLGGALGLKLELIQTEAPVGGPPYYCDILARETNKGVTGRRTSWNGPTSAT